MKQMLTTSSRKEVPSRSLKMNVGRALPERSSQSNIVGNIYKGKIVSRTGASQAAFVDFGVGRNGFLHIRRRAAIFSAGGYDPQSGDQPTAVRNHDRPRSVQNREARQTPGAGRALTNRSVGARNGGVKLALRVSAANQAADSGSFSARRRSAGAGHQGRHGHQGPDADAHQHPRAILVLMSAAAGSACRGRSKRWIAGLHDILRELNSPKARSFHRAPPARTARRRSCLAIWHISCAFGRSLSAACERAKDRAGSTKKAT